MQISSVLSEVEEHRRMHAAQERALLTALRGIAEQDASGLRRSQRAVEKLRQERDASMERFFQCKQGDTAAMSASANVMFGSRKALHRSLCVYVNELNRVQVNRRAVVLGKVRLFTA